MTKDIKLIFKCYAIWTCGLACFVIWKNANFMDISSYSGVILTINYAMNINSPADKRAARESIVFEPKS